MKNTLTTVIIGLTLLSVLLVVSCAAGKGDSVQCPECDNVTELLVGTKCVPIEEVEECGPDGHSHGAECHCFSGQEPTAIGGKDYCLQQGCGGGDADGGEMEDVDALACEALEGAAETVTAADDFARFDEAHADLGKMIALSLSDGKPGFVHFEAEKTGDYAVYLDTAGTFDKALDEEGHELEVEMLGENPDCADKLPELIHILVTNDSGQVKPQVLQFKSGPARTVKLFIHEVTE
ncbi:MAG: hypothetical protein C4523_18420 [Myxococcales bacterium]|nr:MAG: hypothetical protein C4523_18420 [Myxococcales bacterium]